MTPQELADLMDGIAGVAEAVAGFRAQMEAAGFSPTAAEMMAVDFHRAIWAQGQKETK